MVSRVLLDSNIQFTVLALMDGPAGFECAKKQLPGVPYHPCDGSRPRFVQTALRVALSERPDIVLIGHPNFMPLGWVIARFMGARPVVFIYGVDAWKPLPWIWRKALQQSERVISISRYTAQQAMRANGIAAGQIRILHNCLDQEFETAILPYRSKNGFSMLTVGRIDRIEQYKGHDYVIRALPLLLTQFPDLIYNIVGDGDGRLELERLARQMNVESAVRFHGIVSEEKLRACYAQADLFIMPSRAEGFGFVFLEAMAYGIPVIGGNLDATPEVIVDGETGYLVDPTSVESIVNAVSSLLSDEVRRLSMGQAAARYVREKFGFFSFKRQMLSYLAELSD